MKAPPFRIPALAWVLIVAALFALNVRRAATVPVTHDEALTYLRYVAQGWGAVFGHFDSNNHILQTVLCKLIVGTFGLSMWTLRAAGLLGALLFLAVAARLAFLLAGGGFGSAVLFGVAVLNPLVVRELSLARGYSLALGFFGLGLLALIPGGFELSGGARGNRGIAARVHPAAAVAAFVLSVAANLTLLFPCLGAAAGEGWLLWRFSRSSLRSSRGWLRLGLPAAGLALALLAVPAFHAARRGLARERAGQTPAAALRTAQKANYYLGELSTERSVHTILSGSFGAPGATHFAAWLLSIAGILMAAVLTVGVGRSRHSTPRVRMAALFGSSLFGGVAILSVLHLVIALPLPQARTGLALLVLFPFAWGASVELSPRLVRSVASSLSILAGAAVVAQYVRVSLNSDLIVPDSERMIEVLQSSARRATSPWRVSASWFAAPNLEFSRRLLRAQAVAPIAYRAPLCVDDFDAYVLLGNDLSVADPRRFDLVFRDPRSGGVIAIPRSDVKNAPKLPCSPARVAEEWSAP